MAQEDAVYELITSGEFYQEVPKEERQIWTPGRICDAPILYLKKHLEILKLQFVDPLEKKPPMWMIARAGKDVFNHEPLRKPKLEYDEEYAVNVCKRRPLIIVSEAGDKWWVNRQRRLIYEECYLVAPSYTFKPEDSPKFRQRVKGFAYNTLFYVPENKGFGIEEAMIRLDRMQMIPKKWIEPRDVQLSKDALFLLLQWIWHLMTGEADTTILAYRKEILEILGDVQ